MTRTVTPDQIEALLDKAEDAIEEGRPEAALEVCAMVLRSSPGHAGALFVQGDAQRMIGALEEASESYRTAALREPNHAASWASLSLCAFELLRFDEAQKACTRAAREDTENAEAWWVRGLLRERRGDLGGADRALLRAAWLDPEAFPANPKLSDADVDSIVEETLGALHPALREYLSNIAIVLEELPSDEILKQYDPPANPLELLGSFSGHSLRERSTQDPWSQVPGTIVLYRRNLERHATSRADLIDELRITLFHEVGHFLGLDEDDLEDRGLD